MGESLPIIVSIREPRRGGVIQSRTRRTVLLLVTRSAPSVPICKPVRWGWPSAWSSVRLLATDQKRTQTSRDLLSARQLAFCASRRIVYRSCQVRDNPV